MKPNSHSETKAIRIRAFSPEVMWEISRAYIRNIWAALVILRFSLSMFNKKKSFEYTYTHKHNRYSSENYGILEEKVISSTMHNEIKSNMRTSEWNTAQNCFNVTFFHFILFR